MKADPLVLEVGLADTAASHFGPEAVPLGRKAELQNLPRERIAKTIERERQGQHADLHNIVVLFRPVDALSIEDPEPGHAVIAETVSDRRSTGGPGSPRPRREYDRR